MEAEKEKEKHNNGSYGSDDECTEKKKLQRKQSEDHSDMDDNERDELLFYDKSVNFKEYEDYILINGVKMTKPFVEKPANAEDHEVKIYYSSFNPCGSGYNVLFRKTDDRSG